MRISLAPRKRYTSSGGFLVRLSENERSEVWRVSRTIPGAKRRADNESQISEVERSEICWTNYPDNEVYRD